MAQVVGVRFERAGKIYYFEVGDQELSLGDNVVVESSRGLDCGVVSTPVQEVDAASLPQPLKPIMRVATVADGMRFEDYKKREPAAFEYCREQIQEAGLPMKLIKVAYSFDGSKIVFYFSSDNRVDFRDLVKVLAAHFHARIELRQVGVRDEARLVGGYSTCGRELCCAAFLNGFHPVSIKMAKKQNLALNPAKISGVCGRLMCCLYYEYDENAPDEPLAPACDHNCAACADKPCPQRSAAMSEDIIDEIDLEESIAVADSETAAPKPPKPAKQPKPKANRPPKADKQPKAEKPAKPAKADKADNNDMADLEEKPQGERPHNNKRRWRGGKKNGRGGKPQNKEHSSGTEGA